MHYFYKQLPVMHVLSGSETDEITLEFEELPSNDATMIALIAKITAPENIITQVSCSKFGNKFTFVLPVAISKILHGTYNVDFTLISGGSQKKVARGILVVDFSPHMGG